MEKVKRGPLRISVTERGELDSLKNVTLTSSVEGTTTIIFIVPEGKRVEEGELVCELDSSSLVEKYKQQQIKLTTADAARNKAENDVKIQIQQNASDIAAANLNIELADLDLTKFDDGEKSKLESEKKGVLALAQEELIRAQDTYEFSKRIAKKGYKKQNELEADRIAVFKAEVEVTRAQKDLDVLTKYQFERDRAELLANSIETDRELKRVQLSGEAALAQFEAEFASRKLALTVEQELLANLKTQIEGCKILAPQAGEVVYARQSSRRSDSQAIEEGASVRQLQQILKLPDLTQMKVDAKIHESRISLVRPGMKVLIEVPLSTEMFHGEVDSVSSVPLSPDWRTPNLKQYEAIIRITDSPEAIAELKPGLTAQIEIIAEERAGVLQVPVQSVVAIGPKRYAWVASDEGMQRREIVIGDSSRKVIEIKDGLNEGEQAVMNPRSLFPNEIHELTSTAQAQADEDESKTDPASQDHKQSDQKGHPPVGEKSGSDPKVGAKPKNDKGGKSKKRPDRFKEMDKNGDGKLTRDEVPSQFAQFFDQIDANKDGAVDRTELTNMMKKMRGGGGGGRPGGGPPR